MPISTLKYRRVIVKAAVGRYPATADAMLATIPDDVATSLSADKLSRLLDAVWAACLEAKALALQGAVSEGAIYDPRKRQLIQVGAAL